MFTAPSTGENATLFASLIARTAQDIDILIDSLPSQEYTPEKQVHMYDTSPTVLDVCVCVFL